MALQKHEVIDILQQLGFQHQPQEEPLFEEEYYTRGNDAFFVENRYIECGNTGDALSYADEDSTIVSLMQFISNQTT